jgi:hypothetical protein
MNRDRGEEMRRLSNRLATLIALGIAASATPARAQDTPPFDASRVPTAGRQTHDFVPRGWKAAAEATGDLNGDGRADHVLHLVPTGTWYDPNAITAAPTRTRW